MIVDAIVVVLVGCFAALGYHHGLIQSMASFVGFVVGLVIGIRLAVFVGSRIDTVATRIGAVVAVLVLFAIGGQALANFVGIRIKKSVRWSSARRVDRVLGGLVSATIAVLLCWVVALPLAVSTSPQVSAAIKSSKLLPLIDDVVPNSARDLYASVKQSISSQGLPDVLGPLTRSTAVEVGPPKAGLPSTPAIVQAGKSVVKVQGTADQCSRIIDGSGFVFAPERVLTNSHVIAGTSSVEVQTVNGVRDATVVYDDEQTDVAVLKVPGLTLPSLPINPKRAVFDDDAVVAGYPGGGAYDAQAAKIRTSGEISGPNFRDTGTVVRDVYALKAHVIKGNSGGPLLAPDGSVLGVVFASATDNSEVGYALTQGQVSGALATGAKATKQVDTRSCAG